MQYHKGFHQIAFYMPEDIHLRKKKDKKNSQAAHEQIRVGYRCIQSEKHLMLTTEEDTDAAFKDICL